ncbi:hypothetical protein ANN_04123 [Periplaneta americana]|uniref:Uncharacterized protein n=1 Tax=Periplaneta americana TaxID=6978 RepID=A0ABQ8T8W4_PERAM|nr:hypothetical protein ANN_04123 [Periplaneta americana]
MSPGSSTESYPAFSRIGLRENPGKNLNHVTCPDRDSNPGHLVSRPDALAVTPQWTWNIYAWERAVSAPAQCFAEYTKAPLRVYESDQAANGTDWCIRSEWNPLGVNRYVGRKAANCDWESQCLRLMYRLRGIGTARVELSTERHTPVSRVVYGLSAHDGASPHFDRRVRNRLNATFPDRWIGRGGPVPWPPRSPDLSPLDFFLWGDVKRFV